MDSLSSEQQMYSVTINNPIFQFLCEDNNKVDSKDSAVAVAAYESIAPLLLSMATTKTTTDSITKKRKASTKSHSAKRYKVNIAQHINNLAYKIISFDIPVFPNTLGKVKKIRLVQFIGSEEKQSQHHPALLIHGPDVAGVFLRKSNISRLLGQYSSPNEKIIMPVRGDRCHHTGQPSNLLTCEGFDRLMKEKIKPKYPEYAMWLEKHIRPCFEIMQLGK